MKNRRLVPFSLLALALLWSGPAAAGRYDLHLGKYFTSSCTGTCPQEHFESLMTELGQITAPIFLSPAETLGLNGFTFALEGTVAPISNNEDFWTLAAEGKIDSVVFIPHLHLRKGLPFSFEIGTQMSYLPDSELFVVGAELKWALNEGFYYIPDLAVRFSINHTVGAKEFELSTGGWDVSVSKAFGIGGMLSLTPYAGYNMLFIHASSHVITIVNGIDDFDHEVFGEMNWQDNMYHRLFCGVRLATFIFQFAAEGAFTIDGVSMFNFKLGLDY
ncbi:MAG: hypothetical protein JXR96_19250 [Deltaproteobacteria bacterium]|nr:hypothetical protein [Deltaproteobacteria bacterium]